MNKSLKKLLTELQNNRQLIAIYDVGGGEKNYNVGLIVKFDETSIMLWCVDKKSKFTFWRAFNFDIIKDMSSGNNYLRKLQKKIKPPQDLTPPKKPIIDNEYWFDGEEINMSIIGR